MEFLILLDSLWFWTLLYMQCITVRFYCYVCQLWLVKIRDMKIVIFHCSLFIMQPVFFLGFVNNGSLYFEKMKYKCTCPNIVKEYKKEA